MRSGWRHSLGRTSSCMDSDCPSASRPRQTVGLLRLGDGACINRLPRGQSRVRLRSSAAVYAFRSQGNRLAAPSRLLAHCSRSSDRAYCPTCRPDLLDAPGARPMGGGTLLASLIAHPSTRNTTMRWVPLAAVASLPGLIPNSKV